MNFRAVTDWFHTNKRSFPWRDDPTPYRVLISEVMLQQTQAERVIPFFLQWMETFPSLEKVAAASEETIIKIWEGLGYYSRARSLHKAAQNITEHFNGQIPSTKEELLTIPGIGPYTAGAILAFAFHKKAAAVDANVIRVLSRVTEKNRTAQMIEPVLTDALPNYQPWITMEALIELGALICKRSPLCAQCPLSQSCLAKKHRTVHLHPPSKQQQHTSLWRDVALCVAKEKILVCRRSGRGVMSGLYEFPFFESHPCGRKEEDFLSHLQAQGLSVSAVRSLCYCKHSFTRYRATLYPMIFLSSSEFSWPQGKWIQIENLSKLPFSAGHKRIMKNFLSLWKVS